MKKILVLFQEILLLLGVMAVLFDVMGFSEKARFYTSELVFKQGKSQIIYENNFKKNFKRARNKRGRASGFLNDRDRLFYKRAMTPDVPRVTSKKRTRDGFKKKHSLKE